MKNIISFIALFSCCYLSAQEFEIKHQNLDGRLQIHHIGSCEKAPAILIEKSNKQLVLPINYGEIVQYALEAANIYARYCPDVEVIRVAFTPMPNSHQCVDGSECFIEFDWKELQKSSNADPQHQETMSRLRAGSRRDPLSVGITDVRLNSIQFSQATKQIASRFLEPAIRDADDMSEVLAAGRFDIIEGNEDQSYSGMYAYYFANFFINYSRHCSRYIKNPQTKTHTFNTYEYNNTESRLDEIQDKNPLVFTIEADMANAYDRIYPVGMAWMTGKSFSALSHGGASSLLRLVSKMDSQIARFIANRCDDEKLRTIHHNIVAFTYSRKLITDKYTTNIKLGTLKPLQPNSAPKFVASYIEERKKRLQKDTATSPSEVTLFKKPFSFKHVKTIEQLDREFLERRNAIAHYYQQETKFGNRGRSATEAHDLLLFITGKHGELERVYGEKKMELMYKKRQ